LKLRLLKKGTPETEKCVWATAIRSEKDLDKNDLKQKRGTNKLLENVPGTKERGGKKEKH